MDKGYDNNRVFAEIRERGVTPIPYGIPQWKRFYKGRGAVEREFGRLKNEYGSRRSAPVVSTAYGFTSTLTMLARLGQALARARAIPLAD